MKGEMDAVGTVALVLVILVIIGLIAMFVIYYYDRGNVLETGVPWTIINSGLNSSNQSETLTVSGTDLYLIPSNLSNGNYSITVEVKPNVGNIVGRPFLLVNPSSLALTVEHNSSINQWITIGGSSAKTDMVPPHSSAEYFITAQTTSGNSSEYTVSQVY